MREKNNIDAILGCIGEENEEEIFDKEYGVAIADTQDMTLKEIIADISENIVGFFLTIFDTDGVAEKPFAEFAIDSPESIETIDDLMTWKEWEDYSPGEIGFCKDAETDCINVVCYAKFVPSV